MEKAYFPMFTDISDRKVIIIGGGNIAARRAETLSYFAEDITVISPQFTPSLLSLAADGRICCLRKLYEETDILSADIVLAATDSRELNRHIWKDCQALERKEGRQILMNVADDRTLCDFYFPAVIKKEDIVIGINSGGKNPGKVKAVREILEKELEELKITE